MSDSVWSHRWQPTRLPRPWDSPGKNTGVGCHFLLQCMKVKSESEVAQSCPTLRDPLGLQPSRLLRPWDFLGKSTGMGCYCLLRDCSLWDLKESNTTERLTFLALSLLWLFFVAVMLGLFFFFFFPPVVFLRWIFHFYALYLFLSS